MHERTYPVANRKIQAPLNNTKEFVNPTGPIYITQGVSGAGKERINT